MLGEHDQFWLEDGVSRLLWEWKTAQRIRVSVSRGAMEHQRVLIVGYKKCPALNPGECLSRNGAIFLDQTKEWLVISYKLKVATEDVIVEFLYSKNTPNPLSDCK